MFEGSTQTYFYVVVCPTLVCRVLIAIMYKHTLWKLDCVLCKSSIKCQLAHTLVTDSPVDNRYFLRSNNGFKNCDQEWVP